MQCSKEGRKRSLGQAERIAWEIETGPSAAALEERMNGEDEEDWILLRLGKIWLTKGKASGSSRWHVELWHYDVCMNT